MFRHSSTNDCTFHEKFLKAVRQPDKKLLLSLSLYYYHYPYYCHYHYNYRCHYHHCFTIFVQFCLIVRRVFDKCQLSFFSQCSFSQRNCRDTCQRLQQTEKFENSVSVDSYMAKKAYSLLMFLK